MGKSKLGLYIHIPFCVRKCSYCGFLSYEIQDEKLYSDYVEALIREIKSWQDKLENSREIDTIYFGGGTPSLLGPDQIGRILDIITIKTTDCEITIEANPETVNKSKLEAYKAIGINRVSIGIQSFDDKVLKAIGRIHNADQGRKAFNMARQAGFHNISIDLMFSLPLQTEAIWLDTLDEAMALKPEHISFYGLQIEENTLFYNSFKNDTLDFPNEDLEKEMYYMALDWLDQNGYYHYEISNAAIDKDYISKHNMKYWTMKEYLGIGLGASSFLDNKRFKNIDKLEEYLGKQDYMLEYNSASVEALKDLAGETVFTGLRLIDGLDLSVFKGITGHDFFEYYKNMKSTINNYMSTNALILDKNNDKLKLGKNYIMTSNSIMADFV